MIPLAQGDPKNYTPEVRNVGFNIQMKETDWHQFGSQHG
jgi:hypothetical protein